MVLLRYIALIYLNLAVVYVLFGYVNNNAIEEFLAPIRSIPPVLVAGSILLASGIILSDKNFSNLIGDQLSINKTRKVNSLLVVGIGGIVISIVTLSVLLVFTYLLYSIPPIGFILLWLIGSSAGFAFMIKALSSRTKSKDSE